MKRTFTKVFLVALLCLSGFSVFAQNITIKGKVTDGSDKLPLPGASVTISGGTSGVSTDGEGNYAI
ncbi:MAG: hypothetical protein EOP41_02730, partial [Sphingobacteriaceae bacterium]